MTAKQRLGINAPDGSLYITLTDGDGNLATLNGVGTASTTELLYSNAGSIDGTSGWTTNGTTALTGGASTTLAIGGAAIGTNALAVTGTASISGNVTLGSVAALLWSTDLSLYRDAANTLAQRNGTAAQAFNIYNTYTDASNYERAAFAWNSNRLDIGPQAAGTGTLRSIGLLSHVLFPTDNTYDIGASGATRPRNVYIAGSITAGAASFSTLASSSYVAASDSSFIGWSNSRSLMYSPADGVIKLANNANTDFDRLQFGGTTSSFPALKRSATVLQARLADDSGFAPLQGNLRTQANAVAETPTATHTMIITDAGGTAYRVLCVV